MDSSTRWIEPDRGQGATLLDIVDKQGFEQWMARLAPAQRAAIEGQKFDAGAGQVAILPDGDGWRAAAGVADAGALSSWCLARLAETLPDGVYRVNGDTPVGGLDKALFGWQAAQYRFTRYRSQEEIGAGARVLLTDRVGAIEETRAEVEAEWLVRDLVNTPAEDMGPAALEEVCRKLADVHSARLRVVRGDELARDYPMVHAVGRAAARDHAPRLIELSWGDEAHRAVALVGKGVCFDSGGLDIKSAKGMALMKKDMGGAAHAIALAELVMKARLPVRLTLLVPAVENAVSSNAMRPGDVISSRKGLKVEITNTDAEGRLVLGDALARASELDPDLVIDFATLTGAARVALGPDLPALMARRDETAAALIGAGAAHDDEVWRLPLPDGYREWLSSDIADLVNAHSNGFAGASVAGLFLDRFVGERANGEPIDWAHFDTYAWRPSPSPGRPKGGAAYGLRASYHALKARYRDKQ